MLVREKGETIGLVGKCLILVRNGSHLVLGRSLARIAAETRTTPNNSETLRQIILKTTVNVETAGTVISSAIAKVTGRTSLLWF